MNDINSKKEKTSKEIVYFYSYEEAGPVLCRIPNCLLENTQKITSKGELKYET